MAVTLSQEKCIRCGSCMDECPEAAICYDDHNMPYIIEGVCTDCGECIKVCCTEALAL
jgi:NAD-dependent dihydropyrimidine dehydrogenase PreA subunit